MKKELIRISEEIMNIFRPAYFFNVLYKDNYKLKEIKPFENKMFFCFEEKYLSVVCDLIRY